MSLAKGKERRGWVVFVYLAGFEDFHTYIKRARHLDSDIVVSSANTEQE